MTRTLLPVLEIADATAHGGAGSIDFQVSFADGLPSYQTVEVDYTTLLLELSGTATAGQDYEATSGTLIIPPGETAGIIPVPLLGTAEGRDETMYLSLSEPSNATLPSDPILRSAKGTLDYLPFITLEALQSGSHRGRARPLRVDAERRRHVGFDRHREHAGAEPSEYQRK